MVDSAVRGSQQNPSAILSERLHRHLYIRICQETNLEFPETVEISRNFEKSNWDIERIPVSMERALYNNQSLSLARLLHVDHVPGLPGGLGSTEREVDLWRNRWIVQHGLVHCAVVLLDSGHMYVGRLCAQLSVAHVHRA